MTLAPAVPVLSEAGERSTARVITAGVGIGVLYLLSPFTVLFLVGVVPLFGWAGRGVSDGERRWLFAVCRNRALDLLRRSGRKREQAADGIEKSYLKTKNPRRFSPARVFLKRISND